MQLAATSDNAEEVYFNGILVGSDGEVQGAFVDNSEWNTIVNYTISPVPGLNTLDFIVRNYAGSNSPTGNPTGLIYKAMINYEIPDVVWQPPVTNEGFVLKNGTTLPLKFKLYQQDGTLITEEKSVIVEVYYKAPGATMPTLVTSWELGPGVDNLRFDPYEYYYIANVKTKELGLADGVYYAVVFDGCADSLQLEKPIEFKVSSEQPANRSNKTK